MNYLTDLNTFEKDLVRCIVEIPKGTRVKYEIEPTSGSFVIPVRELHKKFKYPFNYGFIPQTLEEDRDPMDVCILGCDSLESLTVVDCVILGAIKTIDRGEQDNKILVAPSYIKNNKKLAKEILRAYAFIKKYKYPYQDTTTVEPKIYSREEALQLIIDAKIISNKHVDIKTNSTVSLS